MDYKEIMDDIKSPLIFSGLIFGLMVGNIIDKVLVLDTFYKHPILREFLWYSISFIVLLTFCINYKNNINLIDFIDNFFLGNRYYFLFRALEMLILIIDSYIQYYKAWQFQNIFPLGINDTFGLFRSLFLSGLFAFLEKIIRFSAFSDFIRSSTSTLDIIRRLLSVEPHRVPDDGPQEEPDHKTLNQLL